MSEGGLETRDGRAKSGRRRSNELTKWRKKRLDRALSRLEGRRVDGSTRHWRYAINYIEGRRAVSSLGAIAARGGYCEEGGRARAKRSFVPRRMSREGIVFRLFPGVRRRTRRVGLVGRGKGTAENGDKTNDTVVSLISAHSCASFGDITRPSV
jgi:hypothetical protein